MATRPAWKKVLYIKQDYPDNYLDEKQFEKDLKENLHVPSYEFHRVAMASLSVLQEVNSVYLFVLVFWLLDDHLLSLHSLFMMMAGFATAMWVLRYLILDTVSMTLAADSLLQCLLLLVFLCGISPVLKTLTQSISTDTIWLMTVVMFFVHLMFHNFGESKDAPLVSDSFSLNAAMFSAVCLASRLHTSLHTLGVVLFAILLFALLPHLRNDLQSCHPWVSNMMAIVVSMATTGLIFFLFSLKGVLVYFAQTLLITCVCPYWFVRLQYLKRTINGPWDIATIQLS